MNRRLVLAAGALTIAGLATLPAQAAVKPFKGSYKVTLDTDPTMYHGEAGDVFGSGCANLNEASVNRRKMTIPGKGTLKVTLTAADAVRDANPALGQAEVGYDWDLHVLADDGAKTAAGRPAEEELTSSASAKTREETITKFTKATKIIIEVCNNVGQPASTGTVTFSFKP